MAKLDWSKLHFGKLKREDISRCVADSDWQEVRASMHYKSLRERYDILTKWLNDQDKSFCAKVQVTNYVNALKRGGMVKV